MFEKVSRSLKYDSTFFGPQTYIYEDTNTNHFTPLVLRVWGKNKTAGLIHVSSAGTHIFDLQDYILEKWFQLKSE